MMLYWNYNFLIEPEINLVQRARRTTPLLLCIWATHMLKRFCTKLSQEKREKGIQRWACMNLMKINKAECKVLHMGRGDPKHKHRLGGEWVENSPQEKDLGVLVDEKLSMTQQLVLTTQQANSPLGCIPSSVGTGRGMGFCPSAPLW